MPVPTGCDSCCLGQAVKGKAKADGGMECDPKAGQLLLAAPQSKVLLLLATPQSKVLLLLAAGLGARSTRGVSCCMPQEMPQPLYLPLGRAVLVVILGRAELPLPVHVDVVGSSCSLPACSDLEGPRWVEDEGLRAVAPSWWSHHKTPRPTALPPMVPGGPWSSSSPWPRLLGEKK